MLSKLLLILMIPSFLLYTTPIPQNTQTSPPPVDLYIPIDPYDEPDLTFDHLLSLIETAENPKAISQLSPADLDKLSHLMTTLAKEGILPGQEDLKDEIDADIDNLQTIDQQFAFMTQHPLDSNQYTLDYSQDYELIRCGWLSKKWKKTCRFARKHKKAIIIGAAAVVVVTAIVITAGVASGAAAATAATAASQASDTSDAKAPAPAPQASTASADVEKISADYKQQLAKTNPELISSSPISEPTIENIRDYSSIITHQMTNDGDIFSRLNHTSTAPSQAAPLKIDQSFGTDLAFDMLLPPPDIHPDAIPHYIVGQKALEYSNYLQALQAFDKAITIDPAPSTYLNRSYTNALLGKITAAQDDFQQYKDRAPVTFTSSCQIAYHFTKGLKNGALDSGKQLLNFAGDIATHPIHTTQQVYDALSHLTKLAYTQQWSELGTALAPEVKLLIEEWNDLPDTIRGERAGYILGKYGADILIPGAAAKIASKSAKQVIIVSRSLKNAERLLPLEAGLTLEGATFAESFQAVEKTAIRSEEVSSKLKPIQQISKVEPQAPKIRSYQEMLKDPEFAKSVERFKLAEKKWKTVKRTYMTEAEAHQIIKATGFPTFSRPEGIPSDYRVKLAKKPGGIKYVHPKDEGTYVRIMPGKPHSPNPAQQKPYVVQVKNGKTLDQHGNLLKVKSEISHVPLEEFAFTLENTLNAHRKR